MPPPKRKFVKMHCHCKSSQKHIPSNSCDANATCNTNPKVVIAPLMSDVSSEKKYRFTGLPTSAAMYNKPDSSDVTIIVNDTSYYAHRNILSASSDVFAAMLGPDWVEGKSNSGSQLYLTEDVECTRVFDRFLYYIYSGTIFITDACVVPLFVLADKYNLKALYDECAKVIEAGLKVFKIVSDEKRSTIVSQESRPTTSGLLGASASRWNSRYLTSSDSSDTTDTSDYEDYASANMISNPSVGFAGSVNDDCGVVAPSRVRLIPSEIFPVALVLRLLRYGHNAGIHRAALLNLEARVGNQISQGNYTAIWNDLRMDVVVDILSDSHFYHPEMFLFDAAKIWVQARMERVADEAAVSAVFGCIRYPLLSIAELYQVDGDQIIPAKARELVAQAIRYKLFRECATAERENWSGIQFEKRFLQ